MGRVLEGANRAVMALDEDMHHGSSMFLPLSMKHCLTISWYVWPIAIIGMCMAILTFRQIFTDVILVKDTELKKHRMRILSMVWTKEIVLELAGWASLWAPYIA
jgi:Zn-dependent protease with chaperone function